MREMLMSIILEYALDFIHKNLNHLDQLQLCKILTEENAIKSENHVWTGQEILDREV